MKALLLLLALATSAHAAFIENTVTVDFPADSPDKVSWMGLDFETGQVLAEPRFEAPNWQLRLRQGYVSTNRGAAAKLEGVTFDALATAPAASTFSGDEQYDPWGPAPEDTYSKPLMDWYKYYMFKGHLLAPKPYVYVLRTASGHYVKLQFLDYVKNGKAIRDGRDRTVGPADGKVHVKVRYRYNTVAGDTRLN